LSNIPIFSGKWGQLTYLLHFEKNRLFPSPRSLPCFVPGRIATAFIPGLLHHVIQRGHSRQVREKEEVTPLLIA